MNVVARTFGIAVVVACVGLAVDARSSDVDSCSRCGWSNAVRTVRRPIHTTRIEEVAYWDVVCEEICPPGRDSRRRIRHKLVRKTFFKEVPVIYWMVEHVCDGCAGLAATDDQPIQAPLEPSGGSILPTSGVERADATAVERRYSGLLKDWFRPSSDQERRNDF